MGLRGAFPVALLAAVLASALGMGCALSGSPGAAPSSGERNLWVLLVGTSRNWLNYRDNSNTIALYRMIRRLGVPDERIILMLGHSMACDPRNPHPAHLYANPDHAHDLSHDPLEVDYRGADVNVESFLHVLTGQHFPGTPVSKQLRSDADSDILIYLTGHGGDKFLKFQEQELGVYLLFVVLLLQDKEELLASDLADALHHMYLQKRYRSILLMTDTCQADSLHTLIHNAHQLLSACATLQLRSPGIVGIASSATGENSYSYLPDNDLGVTVVDRFTFSTLAFLEAALADQQRGGRGNFSLASLFASYDAKFLDATPCLRADLYHEPLGQVPALRYFGLPAAAPSPRLRPGNSDLPSGGKEGAEQMRKGLGSRPHELESLESKEQGQCTVGQAQDGAVPWAPALQSMEKGKRDVIVAGTAAIMLLILVAASLPKRTPL